MCSLDGPSLLQNKAVYEDGKIVMDVKPLDENIKSQKTVREILEDGELLLVRP